MERRDFVKLCAASAAGISLPDASQAATLSARSYGRVKLVDERGEPVRAAGLKPNVNFVFAYPFAATPCFLLNLGKPAAGGIDLKTEAGASYRWEGGVGPERSIVAYSAICAHKLTYPTRDISFISFRAEKTAGNKVGAVIHCCSEHSQYDPAEGARVVAGPAPQPLAAILLEHDAKSDELYAVGTLGGELFGEFFSKYEFKLAMEHGGAVRQGAAGSCVVQELERYCRQQVKC